MLDYTKVAVNQIEKDVKTISFVASVVTQLIYIAYLVYTLFAKTGIFWVNLVLLVLSVAYTAFYIYATKQEMKNGVKRTIRMVYKRCKQLIRLYTLGIMVYGLCLAADNASPLSVVFAVLMLVSFVADILIELFAKYFVSRTDLLLEALKADFESATKPVRTVGNFFKKLTGNEPIEEEPSSARQNLDKQVEELRGERKNKKLEMKYLLAKRKAEIKAKKQAQKQALKEEKAKKQADKQTQKQVQKQVQKQAQKQANERETNDEIPDA